MAIATRTFSSLNYSVFTRVGTNLPDEPDKFCPLSGKERPRIGQEVSTEYDYQPAKLIIRETGRPKYGECRDGCCEGVAVAELQPRLVPQGKLGLGLPAHFLLSRLYDQLA